MALPDQFVKQVGSQINFADHAGDYAPSSSVWDLDLSLTSAQLSLSGVSDGAAQESAKVDLGASRAAAYSVMATFEFAATPVTGEVVQLYWAPSPMSVAGDANPMNIDGVDAGAPSGIGTLAELVKACQFIGNFPCTDDATTSVQVGFIGILVPTERWGILIVKNESGAAFHSDDLECSVVFNPILDKIID